jgi:hypothetical protein
VKELKAQASKLSEEERKRSMLKHPLFNSTHEGYAVIKEEVEEAEAEFKYVNLTTNSMWYCVKSNNEIGALENAKILKEYAICLASEAIQVAAMAQKFIDSFEEDIANE